MRHDAQNDHESAALTLPVEFQFENLGLRTLQKNGEPWLVAADICKALAHSDTSKALARLDDDEKGTTNVRTPGGPQDLLIVSESGLYKLIFTSRLPKANEFRRWVTHEVLPAIRKTGRYALGETQNDPHNSNDHDSAHRSFETVLAGPGLSPDLLLNLLFEDKIPDTGHPTYRFFATDACAALGIAQAEVPIALARLPESERTLLSVEAPAGATKRDAVTEPALYILAFTPGTALPNTTRKSISFLADFHDFFDGKALSHHIKLIEISWLQLKGAFMDLFPGHPDLLRRTEKAVRAAVDEADEFLRRHGERPHVPSDPGDLTRH